MLDEIRKHAANWVVKSVLGVIIFTFIAFFGWSRVANKYQDAHLYVAAVNGEGIPRRKYDTMVQKALADLRTNISGNLPENLETMLQNNVLDQLVARALVIRSAKDMGLTVSDDEVAKFIRNNTGLFANGDLDLKAYERNFLPSYRQKNGEDFEDAVRNDLLSEKVQTLMMTLYGPWQDELDDSLQDILKKNPAPIAKSAETAPLAPQVSSASPLDLFSDWIDHYRQETKVDVY